MLHLSENFKLGWWKKDFQARKIRAYVVADIKVVYLENQILNFKGIHAELSELWHFENEPEIRMEMWLVPSHVQKTIS